MLAPLGDHHLVNVAPTPILAWLKRLDDRVVCRVKMLCRVLVFRRVATPNMPAFKAESQVYPRISRFQAVLTAIRAGRDLLYLVKMCTLHCHNVLPAVKDVMPYHIHTKHCNVAIMELSK
jgi:hypothetical protein